MARPIETADEVLLDAADQLLLTEGPAGFTLAKVAAIAGVSAATLVKRFGSKQAVFLRLSQRWAASLDGHLSATAAPHASPLARFRAVALHNYHDLDNPNTASKQLAALAVDLQDDEMRALLHTGWGQVRAHLRRHATDAIAGGELVGCPPTDQLARIVMGAMEGGCLAWSVHPNGSLIARLTEDLDAMLAPWVARKENQT